MRRAAVVAAAVFAFAFAARAGQPININALPAGARFCPAPGADNSDFMQSYFAIDASTGRMMRIGPDTGSFGVEPEPVAEEQVLFVAPPIGNVANIYVPPPGGSPVPPRIISTGVMPRQAQVRPQPVRVQYAAPQAYPPQTYAPQAPGGYPQAQAYTQAAQAQAIPQGEYAQVRYPQGFVPGQYARPQPYAPQAYPRQARGF